MAGSETDRKTEIHFHGHHERRKIYETVDQKRKSVHLTHTKILPPGHD